MRKNFSKRKNEQSATSKNITGLFLASGIGFISIVILTLFASLILSKTSVLTDSIAIYFIGSVSIGAIITGFIASKKCGYKGLVSGFIASLPLMFYITVIMLIFSHGRLISQSVILYLGVVIFSAIGGIISANTKRRK